MSLDLVIAIPAYNEQDCIRKVLSDWLAVLDKLHGRIVVVNDGSKDKTGELLDQIASEDSRLIVIHQSNAGHGPAVMRAYAEALKLKPNFVFQTDSDDQFQAKDFWKLWAQRNESPFILGFRKYRNDPLFRIAMSRTLAIFIRMNFGVWVRDANIPFRLIERDFLEILVRYIRAGTYIPNIFLSILAVKMNASTFNIPVGHQERQTGVVSIIGMKLLRFCGSAFRQLAVFWTTCLLKTSEIRQLREEYWDARAVEEAEQATGT